MRIYCTTSISISTYHRQLLTYYVPTNSLTVRKMYTELRNYLATIFICQLHVFPARAGIYLNKLRQTASNEKLRKLFVSASREIAISTIFGLKVQTLLHMYVCTEALKHIIYKNITYTVPYVSAHIISYQRIWIWMLCTRGSSVLATD